MSLINKMLTKLNESLVNMHNIDGGLLTSFSDSPHDFEILKGNRYERRYNISRKLGNDTTLNTILINSSKSAINNISSNIFSETIGCIVLFENVDNDNMQVLSFAKSSDQISLYNITINVAMLREFFGEEFATIEKKIERALLQQIPNRQHDYLYVKNKTEMQIYNTINYIVKTLEKVKKVNCFFLMVQKDTLDQEKILNNIKNSDGLINISDVATQGDYRDFVNKARGALDSHGVDLPQSIKVDSFSYTLSDQGKSDKLYTLDHKVTGYRKLFNAFIEEAELLTRDETLTERDLKQKIATIQKNTLPPSYFIVNFKNDKIFNIEVA